MANDGWILLVEDNDDEAELALHAFRTAAVANRILVAGSAGAALNLLFEEPDVPALVLLDLKLPQVSGIEVLRAIRRDARTMLVPVVVLTTSAEPRDRIDSYGSGANSYVVKSVDFSAFTATIAAIARYWLGVNEPAPGLHEELAAVRGAAAGSTQ